MNLDDESNYIVELARVSGTSVPIVSKIVELQMAMLLRDLGVYGQAQTLIGRVKITKEGHFVTVNPNSQIKNMLTNKHMTRKLVREMES
jgi:hypothetical protein